MNSKFSLLALDFGNTQVKGGLFLDDVLVDHRKSLNYTEALAWANEKKELPIMVCAVGKDFTHFVNLIENKARLKVLDANMELPLSNHYQTPKTLGMDRLAGVIGAKYLYSDFPVLVIDAGTCITYDFAHEAYEGGSISPGLQMRFHAMHQYTQKLPWVKELTDYPWTGQNTQDALGSGVCHGAALEMEGFVQYYAHKYPNLKVLLTGGDAPFFESTLKQSIFVVPELILLGLYRIARFHALIS